MWRGFTTLQVGRERERKRGEEEKQKRDGSGKEEQVGLKQSPRHCDLCRPAKHSHQSHRNGCNCMAEAVYMPGTEKKMQWRVVRQLQLPAQYAVVMLVDDCLQIVCICEKVSGGISSGYWCTSIEKVHEILLGCRCAINSVHKPD